MAGWPRKSETLISPRYWATGLYRTAFMSGARQLPKVTTAKAASEEARNSAFTAPARTLAIKATPKRATNTPKRAAFPAQPRARHPLPQAEGGQARSQAEA